MTRKLTVSTLAGMIAIGVIVVVATFGRSGVAFAAVLEQLCGSGYTCLVKTEVQEATGPEVRMSVLPPGRIRYDSRSGIGEISSIVDVLSSDSLFLFHNQRAATERTPNRETESEAWDVFAFCIEPIEQLWNLRDGSQEELGTREIEGQLAEGFRVLHDGGDLQHEITIWAHERTGMPLQVVLVSTSLDQPDRRFTTTMYHFELRDDQNEELFSLEPPEGYTLAYQNNLDELGEEKSQSSEAQRINEMLTLWSDGKKREAIEILLTIDWTQPVEFSDKPYLFSLTEMAYVSLKPDDQQEAMSEVLKTGSVVRQIAKKVVSLGQTSVSAQDHEQAVAYLESARHLGELLNRPDSLVIARLVGIAVQQLALNELIKLHEATGNEKELQEAEAFLKVAEEQAAEIKTQATGR